MRYKGLMPSGVIHIAQGEQFWAQRLYRPDAHVPKRGTPKEKAIFDHTSYWWRYLETVVKTHYEGVGPLESSGGAFREVRLASKAFMEFEEAMMSKQFQEGYLADTEYKVDDKTGKVTNWRDVLKGLQKSFTGPSTKATADYNITDEYCKMFGYTYGTRFEIAEGNMATIIGVNTSENRGDNNVIDPVLSALSDDGDTINLGGTLKEVETFLKEGRYGGH
jgi:hypothetical protein